MLKGTSAVQNETSPLLSPSEGSLHDPTITERSMIVNFIFFSILFASNPCCVLSCMALATARLGVIGAWQSGIIFFTYTLSSTMGATYVVKRLGARNAIILGMSCYCLFVACFILATNISYSVMFTAAYAYTGAAIGGVGGGIVWTAQGVFLSDAAQAFYRRQQPTGAMKSVSDATSYFAGIFACIYLAIEGLLELLPTILVKAGVSWSTIFAAYAMIAGVAPIGMLWVKEYDRETRSDNQSVWTKVTAAWKLLCENNKMKYMFGVNAAYGFSGAFLHSFVSGEVVRIALRDSQSEYVGLLTALSAIASSLLAPVFDYMSRRFGHGLVQTIGCIGYFMVAFPFLILPNLDNWGWRRLIFVYLMYGMGRSTFEGSLKAVFADFFSHEKEGAYANIVLQSGLTSTIGFVFTYKGLPCLSSSQFCVQYNDSTYHDVLVMELAVVTASLAGIAGYLQAARLYKREGGCHNRKAPVS